MNTQKKLLLITPGEPAGIGPDLVIKLFQEKNLANFIIVADPDLLQQRAKQLNLPLEIEIISKLALNPVSMPRDVDSGKNNLMQENPHTFKALKVFPISLKKLCISGQLDAANAPYVLETLQFAAESCLERKASGLITGPVHKEIINEAGIAFSGHTQFLADIAKKPDVVMTFVAEKMCVALLTTHIPLSQVSLKITKSLLEKTLRILKAGAEKTLRISNPRILICGLNPHAGEGGYLGREEIEIITPVIQQLNQGGFNLIGPLPADTIFTPKHLQQADIILAMYHDQALPVVKYATFGQAVNLTLGLPFIRTSVDHGTALDVAGTGQADVSSFKAAVELAQKLVYLEN